MIRKIYHALKTVISPNKSLDKQSSEVKFWKDELLRYQQWFDGDIADMYNTPSPLKSEKIAVKNRGHAAILTWHKLHQETKYLHDLKLNSSAFEGKRVIDIGSGPMPSATCFKNIDLYCLDPLLDRYLEAGFPQDLFGNVNFLKAYSENIPVEDDFFDVVISANALDHVDDFDATATEIKRVLKPDGILAFHIHYHPPSQNEPIELNDGLVMKAFSGIANFRKIAENQDKFGYRCAPDESYALWSNADSSIFSNLG